MINPLLIAKVFHEALKTYNDGIGSTSLKHWEEAEEWQRESSLEQVQAHLDNPNLPDSWSHDSWMAEKIKKGWTYGLVRNDADKIHPMLVPYEQLPEGEKKKDKLIKAIVEALKD